MKVYIFSDMEGVAGIEEWDIRDDLSYANSMLRRRNKHLLTQELNAAADGAFAGGATEVIIKMGHTDSVIYEELDERVKFIRQGSTCYQGIDENIDACFFVGSHSRTGTPDGVLSHTWSQKTIWHINGIEVGELGIYGLVAGCYGIPYVLHTGDTASCREATELMPNIITAPVKKGYSMHSALHLSKEQARALIRKKAEESISKISDISPFTIKPNSTLPFYLFRHTINGIKHEASDDGNGTRYIAPNIIEYYGDDLLAVIKAGTY